MKAKCLVMLVVGAAVLVLSAAANAACFNPRQQLPANTISTFLANPNQLLEQFGSGGSKMISEVRDLAASDPSTLAAIMGLTGMANNDQLKAIGIGLAQAARVCGRTDQAYGAQIQQAVAGSNNSELVLAYTSGTGDVPIGAVGGGGTGTGGPTGGIGNIGGTSGTAQTFGGSPTANSFTNLLNSGSVGTSTTITGTTSNIGSSVSPF
jgi:hypothetical protein